METPTQLIRKFLDRSVQILLIFIFCFGLFLANLAAFAASKLYFPAFNALNSIIASVIGEPNMIFVYVAVMFVYQLMMIMPFNYTWDLWKSYSTTLPPLISPKS